MEPTEFGDWIKYDEYALAFAAMTARAETAEAKLAIAVASLVDAYCMPAASLTGHIKPRRSDRMSPAHFPIMRTCANRRPDDKPLSVPWHVAKLAYAAYVDRFGRSQTQERIAERGGFYTEEMDLFLPGWREMPGVEL